MRIIVWNCNMAFRNKAALLLAYDPDILVIPECENPAALKFPTSVKQPDSILWHGSKPHKGLAVLAYNGYKLRLLPVHEPALQTIMPVAVSKGRFKINLFAVWANNPSDTKNQYVGQLWKAIHLYDDIIQNKKTILAGDFNSNTIWDKPKRAGNHSDVVRVLGEKKISSTYHHHHKQIQGKEEHPSFYLYRHLDKPYHLDYCFASKDLLKKLTGAEMGSHEQWCAYSDHTPLMVDFEIERVHTKPCTTPV